MANNRSNSTPVYPVPPTIPTLILSILKTILKIHLAIPIAIKQHSNKKLRHKTKKPQ
jgi:hypothetical protein